LIISKKNAFFFLYNRKMGYNLRIKYIVSIFNTTDESFDIANVIIGTLFSIFAINLL